MDPPPTPWAGRPHRRWRPRLAASRGDAVARAKLTAVIRLREQLGNRPSALLLYQGYPFDRLRRRLGLELVYPNAVDPEDLGCASALSWIVLTRRRSTTRGWSKPSRRPPA